MRVVVRHVDKYILRCSRNARILLVIQGKVQIGVHGKVYDVGKDQFIVINNNEIYSTFSTSYNNMMLSIQVFPDLIESEKYETTDVEKLWKTQCERPELFAPFSSGLLQIAAECNKRTVGYEERAVMIFSQLDEILKSEGIVYTVQTKKDSAEGDQMRMMKILSEINERCSENLTLEDVADAAFMNYYHLSHFFKDRTGINFRDYLSMCRLSKAIDLLNQKNKSLVDIAFDSGFGSTKAFLAAFRKVYGITPSEYRRRLNVHAEAGHRADLDTDSEDMSFSFDEEVRKLLQKIERSLPSMENPDTIINRKILLDTTSDIRTENRIPLKLLNFGQAKEGLYAPLQDQIRKAVSMIPFDYVRFQGVFSDAMGICRTDPAGDITYCWTYLDMLLDFLVGLGLKICMQLSYMPTVLASEHKTFFWSNVNTSMPKDTDAWCRLVYSTIRHCILRYGEDTVAQWCFEIWNEPDMDRFWNGSKEEFFYFYQHTALAVKSADSRIKVGGPGTTLFSNISNIWLSDFIQFCELSSTPLDFVSVHVYGEHSSEEEEYLFPALSQRRLLDQDVTDQIIRQINEIRSSKRSVQVFITEWNLTVRQRFLVRDTAFMAPYVIDSIRKLAPAVDMIGYWTLSDMIEELEPPCQLFHGGLGMMTNNGIMKPSGYAIAGIANLGSEILASGEGWIAARKGKTYQILAYNMAKFDTLSMNGEFSSLTDTDRYNIYLSPVKRSFRITLNNISGQCRAVTEKIDREHGSAFDEWLRMGAPCEMKREDLDILREMSSPQKSIQIISCDGTLSLDVICNPHGCVFVEISKV